MGYVKMLFWLMITFYLVNLVNKRKDKMIPICVIYFCVTVVNDIFFISTIELANVFGISYQMSDLMLILFVLTILLDVVKRPVIKKSTINMIIAAIVLILIINALLGVITYGISSEWLGDVRSLIIVVAAMLWYARFFQVGYIKNYLKMIDATMMMISIITIILWALDLIFGIHILASQFNATLSDGGSTMRFIQPYEVFLIALYALYLTRSSIRKNGLISLRAMFYLGMVVLFQHRSVWLALALGVIWIIISENKDARHSAKLTLQVLILIVLGFIVIGFSSSDLTQNITNSWELFIKIVTGQKVENSTASTRTQVWNAVIADLNGMSLFVGRPFGYGYASSIGWRTSPHSGYIRFIGRTGYIGVLLLIFLMADIFIKTRRKTPLIPEFLLCVAGFMYGYDATWSCGVILGVAIAYLMNRHNDEVCGGMLDEGQNNILE